ncbi:MAG TPA: SRPBCC family protein [Usitatibacter sp.]|nr:SRPBCC family protein [Usitatibacter sp.]
MEKLQKSFEVAVPVRAAYNQWTQFEQFPRFMDGVKEVRQIDDTHVHWHASVAGVDKEWDAEITEQVPDQVIAWHSVSGPRNAGEVRFEPLDRERTRIQLTMEYEPDGALEKAGDALGFTSRQLDRTVDGFREFLERRGRETGGWRGEVHDGEESPGDELNPPAPLSSREWQVGSGVPRRG